MQQDDPVVGLGADLPLVNQMNSVQIVNDRRRAVSWIYGHAYC